MPKRMTERQLAANRRNAAKSTGPRTAVGRETSKMNALKHGILSSQVLVRSRHYRENHRELNALHQRFRDELQPDGPLEEMLVDQIVTAHWRLRRALLAESGEIALSVDGGRRQRAQGLAPSIQWLQWSVGGDVVHNMGKSSLGNAVLIDILTDVRNSIQEQGGVTHETVEKLAKRLGGSSCRLIRGLEELCSQQDAPTELGADRVEAQAAALALMDHQIKVCRRQQIRCVEDEETEEDARQAADVLPSAETLDKILRYETKLERQIFRAMAQLERLQRMRRGEAVPAPLSVELSQRD